MLNRAAESYCIAISDLQCAGVDRESAYLTLSRVVTQIANAFETDVGSLYLLERDGKHLLLEATVGLLQTCVSHLRMQLHEGLVGLVAEQRSPVVLAEAPRHPRFKYFPEADEDQYHSFLGVPVIEGDDLRGVLVVPPRGDQTNFAQPVQQ